MISGLRTTVSTDPRDGLPPSANALETLERARAGAGLTTAAIEDDVSPVAEPALTVHGVGKRFGAARIALRGVSLQVAPGECVAIVGTQGAGKTTLLKCVLDLARPDEGTILIHGVDSRHAGAHGPVAWLPQRFSPAPHRTGRETLALLADLQGWHGSAPRIDAVLAELGFPRDALDRRTRVYSTATMRRLGLAVTLLRDAPMLVLDDPLGGLDAPDREVLVQALARRRAEGRTLLLTSRTPADVAPLADRLGLLHDGGVLFFGSPHALREAFGTDDLEAACAARLRMSDTQDGLR